MLLVAVVVALPAGPLVLLLAIPDPARLKLKNQEAGIIHNVHAIQVALLDYAACHDGFYPQSIHHAVQAGSLRQVPENPFKQRPMQDIPFGSQPFEGEITYIPVVSAEDVVGYHLLGYGHSSTPGEDVNADGIPDHVIIVIQSRGSPNAPLPSLEDLLQ